jgi:hypothetical protein
MHVSRFGAQMHNMGIIADFLAFVFVISVKNKKKLRLSAGASHRGGVYD